jgi:hypothetical protein
MPNICSLSSKLRLPTLVPFASCAFSCVETLRRPVSPEGWWLRLIVYASKPVSGACNGRSLAHIRATRIQSVVSHLVFDSSRTISSHNLGTASSILRYILPNQVAVPSNHLQEDQPYSLDSIQLHHRQGHLALRIEERPQRDMARHGRVAEQQ